MIQENIFLRDWQAGRLHHAWLLSGPRKTGKRGFAWKMSTKLLTKSDRTQNQESAITSLMRARTHPDLHILEYTEEKPAFSTNSVREAVQFLHSTTSMTHKCRILIIDPVDSLSDTALSVLLKSLEEPTPGTVIFLISHMPEKIIATIRSRCRVIRFYASSQNISCSQYFMLDSKEIDIFSNCFKEIKDNLPKENKEKIHLLSSMAKDKTGIGERYFVYFEYLWRLMLITQACNNFKISQARNPFFIEPKLYLLPAECTLSSEKIFHLWDSATQKFNEARVVSGLDRGGVLRAVFSEFALSFQVKSVEQQEAIKS